MTLDSFYGTDGTVFKTIHSPPFVTFAMYAEVTNQQTPADSKIVQGLRRPAERTHPIAIAESTDKVPLILEFLAKKGADVKTNSSSAVIETKKEDNQVKKRKKDLQVSNTSFANASLAGSNLSCGSGGSGGLAQYLIK